MCGIVGFVTNRYFELFAKELPKVVSSLSHRGPDDFGIFVAKAWGLGLGHTRLSIIDLTRAGRQPMASGEGKVRIIYNGEVYNFHEIRLELEAKGHRFSSKTDTEVVLHAYLEWGVDAIKEFVGMFAFAIWDSRDRKLIIARDRLGIKPLYYYFHEGVFIFASELKALMQFSYFKREIDQESVPLYLHYQYIPCPKTIFKNTYKLLPGHYLILDGDKIESQAYWDIKAGEQISDTTEIHKEGEVLVELEKLLAIAVEDRLISDVPLGTLLSGGIDSTLVVALAQKVSNDRVRTFTIGFEEPGYDEAHWAKRVADHLGTDHMALYVTPKEAMKVIPRLPEIYDEPFADSSAIPTCLVSRLARSQVTVALSGDGGDEQFAGYVRYWSVKSVANMLNTVHPVLRKMISKGLSSLRSAWVEKLYDIIRDFLPQRYKVANFQDKWDKLLIVLKQNEVLDLYRMTISLWPESDIRSLVGRSLPAGQFERIFGATSKLSTLSRLMLVDLKTYLPDCMLTKVDRASMAVGLEVRVPLLDHRIVEFSSRLPDSLKYKNGSGKYLLRKLLAKYVPPELFDRPKMGFGVPISRWFRKELKDLLLDYLSSDRLKREGLFNVNFVEAKMGEHLSGKANHQYRLWALLMWEMWRERWLGDH